MCVSFVSYALSQYNDAFADGEALDVVKCGHPAPWPRHKWGWQDYIVPNPASEKAQPITISPPFQMVRSLSSYCFRITS